MDNIPEPWASAMLAAGFTDRRGGNRPSWRALAERTKTHPSTLSAMASGTRETGSDVIARVAEALRVDVRTVSEWVGQARAVRAPYQPPQDANLLDDQEREAVDRLISLLARSKKRGSGGEPAGSVAPLHVVPDWATVDAARTGDRAADHEPPGDEDYSQDPDDWE